jgi:hypothetical protein
VATVGSRHLVQFARTGRIVSEGIGQRNARRGGGLQKGEGSERSAVIERRDQSRTGVGKAVVFGRADGVGDAGQVRNRVSIVGEGVVAGTVAANVFDGVDP